MGAACRPMETYEDAVKAKFAERFYPPVQSCTHKRGAPVPLEKAGALRKMSRQRWEATRIGPPTPSRAKQQAGSPTKAVATDPASVDADRDKGIALPGPCGSRRDCERATRRRGTG
jgi:hypothetical protein